MTTDVVTPFVIVALLISLVVLLHRQEIERLRQRMVPYRLEFPTELEHRAVAAFLVSVKGLLGRQHGLIRRVVIFEVTASDGTIRHHMLVPAALAEQVLAQLRAAMPGVLAWPDPEHRPLRPQLAVELALSSLQRPLRTDSPATASAAILAGFSAGRGHEALGAQWLLSPASSTGPVMTESSSTGPGSVTPREAREKASAPRFWAVGRLGINAVPSRRASLLRGMSGSLHVVFAPGVGFRQRRASSTAVARRMTARMQPLFSWPCLLNANEAAIVLGFPIGSPNVAGLDLRDRPPLPPSALIPTTGRTVARANYVGQERPLAQDLESLLRHTLVLGPTGTGKSYAAAGMILQDIAAPDRRAVIVIDAKADLVDTVLERFPADREGDVAILDPTSPRPLGLDPLAHAPHGPEVTADQVFGGLKRLWGLKTAPRTLDLLHAALLTLCHTPGAVLPDLAPLLLDAGYRRRIVGPLASDLALGPFWASYQAMSENEWAQVVAPLMTRLRQFLLRPSIRAVLGQSRPLMTVADVMAQGKVLLVPLAAGQLGSEAASLLGALLVADIWITTQARAGIPAAQRRPVSVYIDEWQTIVHTPTPLEEVLAQSRGYRVGYTLLNQHLGQLPTSLRDAVLANARSKISFALSPADASVMARAYGDPVVPKDLERLRQYEVMLRLVCGSTLAPPTTGLTLPLPDPTGRGDSIRHQASQRYGRDRAEVEADLRRHQDGDDPGPVGTRRRS